jgi:hypothetical protein
LLFAQVKESKTRTERMDYAKKSTELETERTLLNKQLSKTTNFEREIAIRHQITAIDYRLSKLYDFLPRPLATKLPHAAVQDPADDESDIGIRTPRMRYVFLRLNNISGSRIKELIRLKAAGCGVGGFVQRTGNNTFSVLAVSPKIEQVQDFTDGVVQNFKQKNVTLVSRKTSVPVRNEKLATYHARGFKKVSNWQCAKDGARSRDLTPEPESDVVSHVSVTSSMWN